MRNTRLQPFLACSLLGAVLVSGLAGQPLAPIAPVKPGGMPVIRSYRADTVPPLRVSDSSRLHAMIRAGNLYLTAPDAIAIAIENNSDLEVERYRMLAFGWDLQRLESGGALRGVQSGSGATVTLASGQGVAGSRSGGGGAAAQAGAANIQQIGPVTPQLDPIFNTYTVLGHQTYFQDQLVQAGTNELVYTTRSYYGQVSQGLLSGGTVRMSYTGAYLNESAPTDVLNPTSSASLGVTIGHNLLKGFGERVNGRFIRAAKRRAANSDRGFEMRLMAVVANALDRYWDLSVASEDVKYKRRNRDIAREFDEATRKEIAVGAIPAVDQVRAKSALALQEQALAVALNAVEQRENALKDALSWHGQEDPALAAAHIIAVDPLEVPETDDLPPLAELLATAMNRRPDVADAKLRAELAEMQASSISNGLLPSLQVFATSSNAGQTGQPVPGASPDPYFVGGAGAALGQVFRRNFPNERVGIRFSASLENTQAQADHAMDQLTHRQTQLSAQKTFNQLAVDVSSQVMALGQARAQYQAAIEHRTIVEKLLQGEERRFQMGVSTIATVVQARRDLATAQSSELAAAAAYIHNRIALDQGLGLTLEANHISVEDAISLPAPGPVAP
jgi:outer membrane protein TolC